jgi:hypothetical protein
MVRLATQDKPEKQTKVSSALTRKALVARCWWCEDYIDMTGNQTDQHIKSMEEARDQVLHS